MREQVASFLAFRTIPTTVAFVVFYAVLFLTLTLTDDITTIPEPSLQRGLSLDDAYADLHHVRLSVSLPFCAILISII